MYSRDSFTRGSKNNFQYRPMQKPILLVGKSAGGHAIDVAVQATKAKIKVMAMSSKGSNFREFTCC